MIEKLLPFCPSMMFPCDQPISQQFGANKFSMVIDGKVVGYKELFGLTGHNGIDIGCPTGTPLVAPFDFEVVDCYNENQNVGYGTTVIARGDPFVCDGKTYRVETVFGHLKGFSIKTGDKVKQGQTFAISDNTGKYTTGPHLHWGCRFVEATIYGGWLAVDRDNGYLGYFDQLPSLLKFYEGKIVYGGWPGGKQNGQRHHLVKNGELLWIPDEICFYLSGFEFKDAVRINPGLIVYSRVREFQLDYSDPDVMRIKNLLGFLVSNPTRAKELYNKYFNK